MGPLAGIRVVEFAGIGPGPMCAMLLADMGATVLRLERQSPSGLGVPKAARFDLLNRGRLSASVDLKSAAGVELALDLVARADALIEGFRPGTMERLGLGPTVCLERNPGLVYGRVTGWGQEGPLARAAGHDLNYIGLTGVLHAIGRAGQPPTPPLNLIGDFAGGSLYLAFGIACALLEKQRSGKGQIVDAAMIDGATSLATVFFGLHAAGLLQEQRGANVLDSGAPYYDVYQCQDGKYVAVAPIESKFRSEFYRLVGLDERRIPDAADRANWPAIREIVATTLASRTQAQWCALLEQSDACFGPVLSFTEAPQHRHHRARQTFVEIDGIVQPAPAPRFSRTKPALPMPPEPAGRSTERALTDWGIAAERIASLRSAGVIGIAHETAR
jgi:alpha-methylacyl-CoA racemase